jgi:LPS export ABC transporter protein LptC
MTIPVLLTGMVFFSCQNEMADIRALEDEDKLPAQTVIKGEYDFTDKGILKNKLFASVMDNYPGENPYLHVRGGFKLLTFNSNGKTESELTAEEGFYFEKTGVMTARTNVRLANINGNELFTEELIWLRDSARVYTEQRVRIVRGNNIILGEGLTADDTFSKYEIHRVTGQLEIGTDKIKDK